MSLLLLFAGASPHHLYLLDNADRLLKENHPEAAVVTAQAACEMYTAQVISDLFRLKNVEFLLESVSAYVFNYSFRNNDRLLDLYKALANNDPINQQHQFWADLMKMIEFRNEFVHSGKAVPPDEAALGCVAARKFLAHLTGVLKRMSTPNT